MKTLKILTITFILLFAFTACLAPSTVLPTGTTPATTVPVPTYPPTELPTLTPEIMPSQTPEPTQAPVEHRIGVRVAAGVGEFYDRVTGLKFIPRGNNYIRLAQQHSPSGDSLFYHSTFNVGLYDAARTAETLRKMHADGYNVVRVFLNGCCQSASLGDPAGGLSKDYLANLADFLRQAQTNEIYVILTTDGLPAEGGYIAILDTTWSEDFGGNNSTTLRKGGLQAEAQLWKDLYQGLLQQGAPMEAVFSFELRNEQFFESNIPPLSLKSGTVQTANGKTYDMSSDADKQKMMDEGLVFWIDSVRAEILKVDATALVSVGFFWPQQPHPARIGDPRWIETRPAIWDSNADFIDLHPYPDGGLSLPEYVDNFGMAGMQAKPIIMGEFGVSHASISTEAKAAQVLHDWQVESCQFGFDGWLLWTWDTDEQPDFYNGLGGEGLINEALKPASRPDPCAAGNLPLVENNLALGAAVQASRSLPENPPSAAVDGKLDTWWGAGDFPSQWIQIDLGKPVAIGKIRLSISQSPAGDTLHQVWVGPAEDQLYLLYTFEGNTADRQELEYKPEAPVENVRFIRVLTRKSPSWVGWREIEVLPP